MRDVGVIIPVGADVKAFASSADALGFDYLGCGEHLFFHAPTYNAFVALSVAAGVTTRIRLASTICLLPLYLPELVAKMTTELDRLSGGRFTLGVGVGGESPVEFAAAGVPLGERGPRADRDLVTVDALLRGESREYRDECNETYEGRLLPLPAQHPRPPIWVAGRRRAAMRRAARYGDGWLPYVYTASQLQTGVEELRAIASQDGRDWQGTVSVLVFVAVHEDPDVAHRIGVDTMREWYGDAFEAVGLRYLVYGDPETCARKIEEYYDAGADLVFLSPVSHPDDSLETLTLLGQKVLPLIRTETDGETV